MGVEPFYSTIVKHELYSNTRNLKQFFFRIFGDISFSGKKILDVGSGDGLLSFFAVHEGATKAVCLEPEAAGSSAGSLDRFVTVRSALGYDDRVTLVPVTFQEFDPGEEKFDIVVSYASINHLDEMACSTMLTDPRSRATYLQLFRKLRALTSPGGKVIIVDCSRYNFFSLLSLTNPFARTITWEKHQSPAVWARLLEEAGFVEPRLRWLTFNTLGSLGRLVLGNPVASYFFDSLFCLSVEAPEAAHA